MKGYSNCREIMKRKILYNDDSLREGEILEFYPGYHTEKPYFVEVVFWNPNAKVGQIKMVTQIPGHNSCEMMVGSNWEYHRKRIMNIYYKPYHTHLLYNQDLK